MGSSFDRWEKDPFFSAAEEVQDSADRMESTYRTWIHAEKEDSSMWDSKELRRDLHTALGTTKWQLEEFERAVRSSYVKSSRDDTRGRHHEFVIAIEDQISKVENSLQVSSTLSEGKASLPWMRFDEGECNELASFLLGSSMSEDKTPGKSNQKEIENPQVTDIGTPDCSVNSPHSAECMEAAEGKSHGHRRTASASASADIGAWKIVVPDDGHQQNNSKEQTGLPVRKIPSLTVFPSSMESASKLKWSKNGFRKWKAMGHQQGADSALLQSTQLSKGINACYEKSKSCLDGCNDCYDKQFYGWYGAIQRQLQRSQYQMQYSRSAQVTFWIAILLCLLSVIMLIDSFLRHANAFISYTLAVLVACAV